jgi:hypothetical protein
MALPFIENVFIHNDEGTKILCKFCHNDSASKDGLFLPESETEDSGKQTRRFLNLKRNVVAHLCSKSHKQKTCIGADDNKWNEHALSRNKLAQVNVGRIYYVSIKHQDSYRSTEDRLATAKSMGVEVGEVHHSRHHAADFVRMAYSIMLESVKDYFEETSKRLGFPLPFGITADKDTSKHRSRQVRTSFKKVFQESFSRVV